MREKSITEKVRKKIEVGGTDKLWTYAHFESLPTQAVATALSRLAKEGVIERVRKGVYYKPKETRFGRTAPDGARVAVEVLKGRKTRWGVSGLPIYNALGLTTQISAVPTFDVNRETRSLHTGSKTRVRVKARNRRVKDMTHEERGVLDALRDIKSIPDTDPAKTVGRIADLTKAGRISFERLVKLAKNEPPRVKALLGVIGEILGKSTEVLRPLKAALNPTTTYKIGISASIPEAEAWKVK
jgi:hypothetical protein